MPSKSKKQSKTASRLSNSDQSASPCRPSSVPPQYKEVSELDILDAASTKYPKMIGKSAFIGRIADTDPDYKGCRVWLAESSMVSSSISPGSLVSVSLPALERGFSSTSPISSMTFECSRKFEIQPVCEAVNEVGNYFALATIFPSSKVPKDGVRLSSNLSYTMGSPAIGRVVFVYPLWNQHVTGLENGNDRPQNIKYDPLLHDCNDLHLELVSFKDVTKPNGCVKTTSSFSAEKDVDRSENGMISSPKTPLCLSKRVSSTPVQVSSPRSIGTASDLSTINTQCLELFNTAEVLKDESAKKLLQACAASWLYSRFILVGNIVAIPILSKLCIFQVRSANMSTADGTKNDLEEEKTHSLHAQFSESMGHFHDVFSVNFKTKVYLSLPSNSATEIPQTKSLASKKLEQGRTNGGVVPGLPKLGGLHKEYAILKDIIVSSLKNTLSSLGLRTTKGVLLHGPPGTGKTSLARLCVADAGVNLFSINGPEIISQYHGESEQAMHEVFDSACQATPAVVFIDELDAIAPARKDGGEELSQRMVASLLNLMDGISRTEGLLIIAATNRPDSIEPALRRPGRLDREIEIGVPSPKQRSDILHTLLSKMDHSISDEQVQHLAMATHGFVGADLASLCNEAALVCLRRFVRSKKSLNDVYSRGSPVMFKGCSSMVAEIPDCSLDRRDILMDSASSNVSEIADDLQNSISEEILVEEESMLKVVAQDFEKARVKVRPSAMREVILEVPKVSWEDVGGQDEVKTQLIEAVEWPQKHHDAFKRIGTQPPTGILMFGPPGCSKTLVARAVASEAGLNFLAVKGPELFSKWVGESEKAVRSLFAKARANAPSIIFFDEIDGLAVIRGNESDGVSVSDRVMSQLLIELDGLHQRVNVTVIAATNRPDKIDPALLRPGRFDRLLYVGPPNENDREAIFRIHLRKIPCSSDVNIKELASLTDGYTGADISLICREAAVAAIEESIGASEVTMHHFETAIQQVQPSDVHSYEELSSKFQRVVHCSHSEGLEYQKQPSASSWFGIRALIKLTAHFFDFSASSSKSVSSG